MRHEPAQILRDRGGRTFPPPQPGFAVLVVIMIWVKVRSGFSDILSHAASIRGLWSGSLAGSHGGAGVRGVGGVHDLGEGASGGSLTFSPTPWGRWPAGQRGLFDTIDLGYRRPPANSWVAPLLVAGSSRPPAVASGGQEKGPLSHDKPWIQAEGEEEAYPRVSYEDQRIGNRCGLVSV